MVVRGVLRDGAPTAGASDREFFDWVLGLPSFGCCYLDVRGVGCLEIVHEHKELVLK